MLDHARPGFVSSRCPCLSLRPASLLGALVLLAFASPVSAQPDAATSEKLVALRLDLQSQLARQDVAVWETDVISAPRGTGLTVGNFSDPSAVLKELRPVLAGEYDVVRNGLIKLADKAKARREEAQKDWAEVVRQRAAFRQYV